MNDHPQPFRGYTAWQSYNPPFHATLSGSQIFNVDCDIT